MLSNCPYLVALEYNQNLNINGINDYVLGSKPHKKLLEGLTQLKKHPWFTPTWCYRERKNCTSYEITGKALSLFNISSEKGWLIYHNNQLAGIYAQFSKTNQNFKTLTTLLRNKYIHEKYYDLGDFKELYIYSVYIDLRLNSYSNLLRLEDSKYIKKILREEIKESKLWRNQLNTDMHYERLDKIEEIQ